MKKIKEYLEHYENSEPKEITQPLPKKDFKDCVDPWDYEYINLPSETILEIMLAANFMDIKPLLELTCAKIASIIKGKNTKEIIISILKNDIKEYIKKVHYLFHKKAMLLFYHQFYIFQVMNHHHLLNEVYHHYLRKKIMNLIFYKKVMNYSLKM